MEYTVVIPARYASTRLPGKPLLDIGGKPMIQRVYEQATKSSAGRVVVATDDNRIFDTVLGFGGEACITSTEHQSGTDRQQEVASKLGLSNDHILVNVQGDEPLMPPQVIDQVAWNLADNPDASVATLAEPIESDIDFNNPNIVKVVCDENGFALYFSRAPIPFPRDAGNDQVDYMAETVQPMRHIGIYAYRAGVLNEFVTWPVAPLEKLECLEQLRFMWHGRTIHVAKAMAEVPGGVDTPDDLERIRARVASASANGS
ncbi:MAG: 3-deoxy-manno-octulosonate cytidylyltransferase [bacterium]